MNDESSDQLSAEDDLWRRAILMIREHHGLITGIKVVLVLGGTLLAGIANFMESPGAGQIPWRTLIGCGGALFSGVGGLILLATDRGSIDLLNNARDAIRRWAAIQAQRDRLDRQLGKAREDLERQQHSIVAFGVLIQALESVIGIPDILVNARLDAFLGQSITSLTRMLELATGDDWTISIFRIAKADGDDVLVRVAAQWEDRAREARDARSWPLGIGWTGAAWERKINIIEAQATSLQAKARYKKGANFRDDDDTCYRSIAAIPFRIGSRSEIHGVVTATSRREHTFSAETTTPGGRNVAAVKSFAQLVAVIVAADFAET